MQGEIGRDIQTKRQAPVARKYKANVDSAFRGGKAGIGVVIRDDKGEIIASLASPVSNVSKSKHLEALAVAKRLEIVNELALTGFTIESDCLEIVNRVNSVDKII